MKNLIESKTCIFCSRKWIDHKIHEDNINHVVFDCGAIVYKGWKKND